MFGWLLVGVCPSFHCFHIGSRGASLVGGVLWVWLGGTLLLLQFRTGFCGLGTLLGPEGTPVCGGVCSWCRSWAGWSNAWFFCVVAAVVLGCGCVLSVA